MKSWFESLASRERLLVTGGAAALLLLLIYAMAWAPLRSAHQAMRDDVAEQRETVVWMQETARKLVQIKGSRGPAAQGLGGQSLLALADSSARADGLGEVLKRVEPEGSDSVKVWMDGAPFDVLMRWLGNLSTKYGIRIDTVTLERTAETNGRVNVRLTLQAAGL
jgi:general secretion pathway protein M